MHFVVTVQRSGNFLPPLAAHPVAAVRPAVPAALTMSLALALAVPARDEAAAQVYVRDSVYCVSSLARRRNQRIAYCHLFCSFFILLHLLFRALSPCRAVPCSCCCCHFTRHLIRSIWVSNAKSLAFSCPACSTRSPQADVVAVRTRKVCNELGNAKH